MKPYQRQFKEAEEDSEEKKSEDAIKYIIQNKWSGSNESQAKMTAVLKGLAMSDSDVSNKFMKKLDDFTSTLDPSDFKE